MPACRISTAEAPRSRRCTCPRPASGMARSSRSLHANAVFWWASLATAVARCSFSVVSKRIRALATTWAAEVKLWECSVGLAVDLVGPKPCSWQAPSTQPYDGITHHLTEREALGEAGGLSNCPRKGPPRPTEEGFSAGIRRLLRVCRNSRRPHGSWRK